MPVTSAHWMLAFSPIITLILLMTVFKMGGSKAGVITWLAAQLIAYFSFGTDLNILTNANMKAFFLALDVLLIIWGAMFLYQVTEAAGTIQNIGGFLSEFTDNKAFLGIFLGWLFPSFLQGVGGFGVPVAVSAPLLVSAGFSPILSVVLASLGHGWGVSFGSMGTSIRTLEAVTGLPTSTFAPASAILLGITAIISGILVVWIAGGKEKFFSALPLTILSGAVLSIGQYLLSQTDFWVFAVTLPALVSLLVGILLTAGFSAHSRVWVRGISRERWWEILSALLPYALLVFLILMFYFIQPLRALFGPFTFSIPFPAFVTHLGFETPAELSKSINLFLHPGTILFTTGALSLAFFMRVGLIDHSKPNSIIKKTVQTSRGTTIAVLSLVGAAVVMGHAGMISLLAQGISAIFPRNLYPLVSPFIGALGAFITGSNNNSNVLFAALQLQTAELLHLPAVWILAAQTTGGALGSVMAPAKVILGCNTVGLEGKEGQVIGRLILTCLAILLVIGLLTFLFTR